MATSSPAPLPPKQDIPKELFDAATTLSKEAQAAALRKAKEMGFDLSAGRIPLHETLLNLAHARDVLLDIVENGKLVQLPLKVQYTLLTQTQRGSQHLVALGSGTDTVVALEDAVDDLTTSIWQYNLQNLSGEVLGFARKMNELKVQETQLRELQQEADAFLNLRAELQAGKERLEAIQESATETAAKIEELSSRANTSLEDIGKAHEEAVTSSSAAQDASKAIAGYLESVEAARTSVAVVAGEVENVKNEIAAHREALDSLQQKFAASLQDTQTRADAQINSVKETTEELSAHLTLKIESTEKELRDSIVILRDQTEEKVKIEAVGLENSVKQMRTGITTLIEETDARLRRVEADQTSLMNTSTENFEKSSSERLEAVIGQFTSQVEEVAAAAKKSVGENEAELKRLTENLNELEERISKSIERATGYTLFHSFQERQLQLGKEKQFWARCLGGAVGASVLASGWFIRSLPYVKVYNAAFYMKLSISLPIIYAIAFCGLQYSRERRLEEEYAFKSSISISLDPYQRLVKGLVDQDKPDEVAKYTAFVIESINKVFTSPTEPVFAKHEAKDTTSLDKVLKQLRDLLEPIISLATKK